MNTQSFNQSLPSEYALPEHGYYRIKHDHADQHWRDKGFVKGELAYVIPGQSSIHVLINECKWTYDFDEIEEFHNDFEYDPNGASERQAEIAKLMQEVIQESHYNKVSTELISFHPHVADSIDGSTGLIPANGSAIQDIKKSIAETKNLVLRTQRDLKLKTKRLEIILSEQTRALEIKARELEGMMKKAEEAIWTINLYLGKNEEIHHIRSGEPAPADQKIAIRQRVLYMDEECALSARNDGIDVQSIEEFDNWITSDESHIQQVIPEPKCIVAFHIKRHRKEYNDPWVNAQLNDANIHWTYFLIRNGENLYRVFVDIVIGTNLFPTEGEYNTLLMDGEEALKPGSKEYMRAMEASDAKSKHYLRVVLILQGLLDRTPIFKPMPVERINICNPNACEEFLRLVYDNENLLDDNRPQFSKWQKDINDKLDVGHRIIGIFDYASKLRGDKDYEESRIYPRTARYPDSYQLHTIEKRDIGAEGEAFVILYDRTGDTIYRRYHGCYDATVRARCLLYRDDRFILNFDAANLEDMEYYFSSRKSRHDYKNMMPVLEAAIKLKKQEATEEAPFRLLLIGQIIKRYQASHSEVESRIDELIKWWKFKNRTHRALTSDDDKALKMIVAEFGYRLKQESVRNKASTFNDIIIDTILAANQGNVIMIAHKSDNKYVAYVAHNAMNVWVHEQIWTHNRTTNAITLSDDKEWKLVDKRHMRWDILYKSDRWDSWKINPQMSQVLTDAELQAAVEFVLSNEKLQNRYKDDDDEDSDGRKRFLPLCACFNESFAIHFWFSSKKPLVPQELILSSYNEDPQISRVEVSWERKKDGVSFKTTWPSNYSYNSSHVVWFMENPIRDDNYTIIKLWDENIQTMSQEYAECAELRKRTRELRNKYQYVTNIVSQLVYEAKVAKARHEYDIEYGDPELWDDHLSELKIEKHIPHLLSEALLMLAERNIDVVGMTVGQVFEKAIQLGLFEENSDTRFRKRGFIHLDKSDYKIPDDTPMDFVIPERPEDDDINEDE